MALRGWQRYIGLAIVVSLVVYSLLAYRKPEWLPPSASNPWATKPDDSVSKAGPVPPPPDQRPASDHPIDRLIRDARLQHRLVLGKRSLTVEQAASRYRERRGRHPPPGFDAWFQYAHEHGAVVVEDFFDRVHHDINPFWAIDARTLRIQTHTQPELIRIRGGAAQLVTEKSGPWIRQWFDFVKTFAKHLPDLDMVLNVMDETRLLVPWEKIDAYVRKEQASRAFTPLEHAVDRYSGLADVEAVAEPYEHRWIHGEENRFWDHLRAACPPNAPSRNASVLPSFADAIEYPARPMPYTYQGFVQNFTESQDPCLQPHLRGMHGTFIESVSMSTAHELFPMFAGCKMPQNNEILIPGAMYVNNDEYYSGGQSHGGAWADKKDGLVWRGTASGGRNKVDNWWHFHRHRWVQMTNGTTVAALEAGEARRGPTFHLPPADVYRLPAPLGDWVSSVADVGFVDLECFPGEKHPDGSKVKECGYTSPVMSVASNIKMKDQYDYKFLPDVDGNSYSARWRSFLRSTSTPLKATIYAEWHDDRLTPWVHFVPFDSSYMDIYGVVDYFLRGHDAEARRIADEGRDWAEAVLRNEDMVVYVWRLLLEYARVVDDKRDVLAYVADLR